MGKTQLQLGHLDARDLRLAIIVSRYNPEICERLLDGSLRELNHLGLAADQVPVYQVPGCFEIPLLAKELAKTQKYDALICLGAVIQGETSHFLFVCTGITAGLTQAMLETGIPMAFGILTTQNEELALARSGSDEHNKGSEAARTAVEMALIKKGL